MFEFIIQSSLKGLKSFTKLCVSGFKVTIHDKKLLSIFSGMVFIALISVTLYMPLCGILFLPCIFLAVIGFKERNKLLEVTQWFNSINFKSRAGVIPRFLNLKHEDKKDIYTFVSDIPMQDWKKCIYLLEHAFDCEIFSIEACVSKKVVKMHTSKEKLKEKIDWDDKNLLSEGKLTIGENLLGPIKFDLNKSPHVLVAGETGSGKSVTLGVILWQLIKQECKIYMTDFKGGVEFGIDYEKYGEVIIQRERFLKILEELTSENTSRLEKLRNAKVKNIAQYNKKTGEKLQRIALFIDELAELMAFKGKNKEEKELLERIEGELGTLARLSRCTGINLIVGMQRPDANVLPGQIKNNLTVRICGRFADNSVSEIVLGNTRATTLQDIKGRMLFKIGADTTEFQGYFFDIESVQSSDDNDSEKEIEKRLDDGLDIVKDVPLIPVVAEVKPQAGIKLDLNF